MNKTSSLGWLAAWCLMILLAAGWLKYNHRRSGQTDQVVSRAESQNADGVSLELEKPRPLPLRRNGEEVSPVHADIVIQTIAEPSAGGVLLRIEGRVTTPKGISATPSVSVSVVSLHGSNAKNLLGTVKEDSTYSMDASNLLGSFLAPGGTLMIEASCQGCASERAWVGRNDAAVSVDGASTSYTIQSDFSLLSGAIIVGRVVSEDEQPLPGVPIVVQANQEQTSDVHVIGSSNTSADGTFATEVRMEGPCLLSVLPLEAEPHQVSLILAPGERRDLGIIRLAEGSCIRGHLRGGSAWCPIAGARISVFPVCRNGSTLTHGSLGLLWNNGRLDRYVRYIQTDASGAFTVGGLSNGDYGLVYNGVDGTCTFPGTPGLQIQATAPSEGIEFLIESSVLVINVLQDGVPLPRAGVTLDVDEHPLQFWTNSEGRVVCMMPPLRRCDIRAEHAGVLSATLSIVTPDRGGTREETLALGSSRGSGAIALEVSTEGGPPPTSVGVGLFEIENALGSATLSSNLRKRGDGTFRLANVPTGRFLMKVCEGEWNNYLSPYLLGSQEVDIPEHGITKRRVVLLLGGRTAVRVSDGSGMELDAKCSIFDSVGNPVQVVFFRLDASTNTLFSSSDVPFPPGSSGSERSVVFPALVPGGYEARFFLAGYHELSVPFDVAKGELRMVDAVLARMH